MIHKERHAGIVMVKPHAFEHVLDPIVADILDGGEATKHLSEDDPLRSYMGSIEMRAPIIRDLRSSKIGTNLLTIFYGDKREKRYFPLIMERYMGKVAFLPYVFHGQSDELPQLYDAMKGTAETFDADGGAVSQPLGVRGLLSKPYLAVDASALSLNDIAYRTRCLPMVDNVFHVCDTPQQNEQALQLLGATNNP
jgi:hypothetical protein